MGCHLIALGGTGQKTLEMLTYACACDALYTLDDDLRRWPPDFLSVLTLDTDTAAAEPAALYQALQTVFSSAALPRGGVHTRLYHEHLAVVTEGRSNVQSIAAGRDQLLTRTLFSLRKSTLDAREGLRGLDLLALERIERHEKAHKNRKTVLEAVERERARLLAQVGK